jgi:hypothetical protein
MLKVSTIHVFAVMLAGACPGMGLAGAGIQLVTALNKPKYLDTGFRRCDESFLD